MNEPLRVCDFDDHFRKLLAKQKRKGRTCDGLKFGDLGQSVSKVAVAWMATTKVIREAIKRKCDLIIHHEPLFYDHWDEDGKKKSTVPAKRKRELLKKNSVAVYRVHDAWDFFPEYGVLDSLAKKLGFTLGKSTGFAVAKIRRMTCRALCRHVKSKLGISSLQFSGDPDHPVSTVWLAIGAWGFGAVEEAVKRGVDCIIVGETSEWQSVQFAQDAGLPLIQVGHCVSERDGIRGLKRYLEKTMPGPEVLYLETGHPFRVL